MKTTDDLSGGTRPDVSQVPRILVVDGDPTIRRIEASLLRQEGYAVDIAADGGADWSALSTTHYDLLITDQEMVRRSGAALVGRMRDAGLSLPVIVTSGLALLEIITPAAEPMPWLNAFIERPFSSTELRATVQHVLGQGDGDSADNPSQQVALSLPTS